MALILNTVIVLIMQVRVTRSVTSLARARTVVHSAGAAFVAATVTLAAASTLSAATTAFVLVVMLAVVVHALGEVCHAAGGFEASYAIAPSHRHGEYQAAFALTSGLALGIGPLAGALLATRPTLGWLLAGALLGSASVAWSAVVAQSQHAR